MAVLRVAISYPIADADIRQVVGEERLADISIRLVDDSAPTVGRVQSAEDVERVRLKVREAMAALRAYRPNVELIHLFIAAPVSVCFATGQELRPRNSAPVQTYRYRKVEGEPSYRPAIVISAREVEEAPEALEPGDLASARHVRLEIWPRALADVIQLADYRRQRGDTRRPWHDNLELRQQLSASAPFPRLPPLASVVPESGGVDEESFSGDYGYDKDRHRWRLGDRLLVSLYKAADGDDGVLQRLIRLFLLHEYLHDYHSLSKYTAAEVGKFANCLEQIDYTADTYALLHELDWVSLNQPTELGSDKQTRLFIAEQIDLIIRSFWAFEPPLPNSEWQVRRLRRYLNWYWRQIQILRSPSLSSALQIFNRAPKIEIAGIDQIARGRRVVARLDRLDPRTHLELGLVLEDERMFRVAEAANTSITGLLNAFRTGAHEEIKGFFRAVFEFANQTGGALPQEIGLAER